MDMKEVLVEGVHYEKIDNHPRYKYRMLYDLSIIVDSFLGHDIEEPFFSLHLGLLTAKKGYCWDGPSVPWFLLWVTKWFGLPQFLRASLFHDIIYQMLREGQLMGRDYIKSAHNRFRKMGDDMMYEIGLIDGMVKIRIKWCRRGVRIGGRKAAQPQYMPRTKTPS